MRLVNLLLGGWTGVVFLFLYLPVALLIVYSFNDSKMGIVWKRFTARWYAELWSNAALIDSFKNSLIVAAWTTVLATLIGTAGGWLLFRYKYPFMRAITTLVFVPMIIPEIIMGVSLLIFFAVVNTYLNRTVFDRDVLGLGFTTVIISHVTFCFPFVMVAVQARLAGIDPALEEAAMDLGATPAQAFFRVIVPYLLPAILSGALMSFTLSMDEFIVTYFTMGPSSQTLPIKVFGEVKKGLNPQLNALSTLFIVGTAVLVLASEWLRRRGAGGRPATDA
jgi:spermidine/putrescine transport system permease protein